MVKKGEGWNVLKMERIFNCDNPVLENLFIIKMNALKELNPIRLPRETIESRFKSN